jgi:hypothetical protein
MKKVGIIGYGYWGKILEKNLQDISNITFISKKEQEYIPKLKNVDWVFISTPDQTHYSIVKKCLNQKVNVFCEKPLTLTYKESKILHELADKKGLKLYCDDVFNYRKENQKLKNFLNTDPNEFYVKWKKFSRTDYGKYVFSNFYNLAWHDLYLLYPYLEDKELKEIIPLDVKKTLNFTLKFSDVKIHFLYDRQSKLNKHEIGKIDFTTTSSNPLKEMLENVLEENVDFEYNKNQSLFVNSLIEKIKQKLFPEKIAVIGGGIFGCTIASNLSKEGINIDLFEKNNDILTQASHTNQYRIHRGYHYPRSKETALQSKIGAKTFQDYYPESVINNKIEHYYGISSTDSLTTPNQYLKFMDDMELEYSIESLNLIKKSSLSLLVKVNEYIFDPYVLKKSCRKNLQKYNVNLNLNNEISMNDLQGYDYIINSTYSNLNSLLPSNKQQNYQFELCEKPVVKLPKEYQNKSIVIMDGPFMCIDPLGNTGYHVMGNVVHAIHNSNIGKFPIIPKEFKNLLNKGIISNPHITKIDKFISSAKKYFYGIENLEHIGSMFTFRTVLPDKEKDDARPTIVKKVSNKELLVFSGKIPTCVEAYKEIKKIIKNN